MSERDTVVRCLDHARNVRFLGSLAVKVRIRGPEVIHTKSNLTAGLLYGDEICSWYPGSDYPSPCSFLPSFLDLSAFSLLLSTSISRVFPHPGAVAGQAEAPRPILMPQGSLVFNRLLLKMLTGCPESPRVTLSHQNPQLELQLVNTVLGLSPMVRLPVS